MGSPGGTSGKESPCQCKRCRFDPWVWKIPWRRERPLTAVFWPGEFWGLYVHGVAKSRTRLSDFHFHLSIYTHTHKLGRVESRTGETA